MAEFIIGSNDNANLIEKKHDNGTDNKNRNISILSLNKYFFITSSYISFHINNKKLMKE
jgi:hypothetical protein